MSVAFLQSKASEEPVCEVATHLKGERRFGLFKEE
jgi:hypothetical protein